MASIFRILQNPNIEYLRNYQVLGIQKPNAIAGKEMALALNSTFGFLPFVVAGYNSPKLPFSTSPTFTKAKLRSKIWYLTGFWSIPSEIEDEMKKHIKAPVSD